MPLQNDPKKPVAQLFVTKRLKASHCTHLHFRQLVPRHLNYCEPRFQVSRQKRSRVRGGWVLFSLKTWWDANTSINYQQVNEICLFVDLRIPHISQNIYIACLFSFPSLVFCIWDVQGINIEVGENLVASSNWETSKGFAFLFPTVVPMFFFLQKITKEQ